GPAGSSASGPVMVTRASVTPATSIEKRRTPEDDAGPGTRTAARSAKRSNMGLHPEHAELRLRNRRVVSRRERQGQGRAGLRGVEHAVVPEARRRVKRMAFRLVLLARRPLELRDLPGPPGPPFGARAAVLL